MERRVWQRTKQAAQATARFVKYLPLAASLMLYACGSCQVEHSQKLETELDKKRQCVITDNDTSRTSIKNEKLGNYFILLKEAEYNSKREAERRKHGVGVITEKDTPTQIRGEAMMLMQASNSLIVENSKTKKISIDSIPIPIERQIEGKFYYPWNLNATAFNELSPGLKDRMGRAWRGLENEVNPFQLSDSVLATYSPQELKVLRENWEVAKQKLRVAFLSNKGATPENALDVHSEAEKNRMLQDWESRRGNDLDFRKPYITPIH